jgi:putative ABC transport system permease protein
MQHGFALVFRDPGFSAAVIGVLALGIGATVAMFTIVDSTLFKPLPFPGGERIVQVWEAPRPGVMNATSTLDFLDWQRLGTDFESLAAENSISVALTGGGEPVRLAGKAVTADYFRVVGASARLGRTFVPTDDQVLVLSHAVWKNDFGGDAAILTRKPLIDGVPHQVIGVLPPGAFDRDRAQFWKPLVFTPEQRTREIHWLTVYGRLGEGASLEQTRKRMTAIRSALVESYRSTKEGWVEIRPLESLVETTAAGFWLRPARSRWFY